MMIPSFLQRCFGGAARTAKRLPSSYKPRLECLEDRLVPSSVLTVDDDKVQNPGALFTTIGAAVAAANPGDTIKVYAGTYSESVDVPKTLEFEAVRRGGAVIVDPSSTGANPAFNVHADKVEIEG